MNVLHGNSTATIKEHRVCLMRRERGRGASTKGEGVAG